MFTKVRNPNIQILLHKVVTRIGATGNVSATTGSGAPMSFSSNSVTTLPTSSSYSALNQTDSASNIIDVTKWLGEGSVVHVQKSVRGDGGAFSRAAWRVQRRDRAGTAAGMPRYWTLQ
jgi:hypothetical protein